MNRIAAIALLTVRSAVRSRMLFLLAVAVLVLIVAFGCSVKGDGTVVGRLQVLLSYSLGTASAVLSLATLWTACACVSRDVQGRQIRLVRVKPVRCTEIWLGKWLGLLIINTILLTATGAAVYAAVRISLRYGQVTPAELRDARERVLVGRRLLRPVRDVLPQQEISDRVRRWRRAGNGLPDVSEEHLLSVAAARIRAERRVVRPGREKEWTFEIPAATAERDAPAWLRIRFLSTAGMRQPLQGSWHVGAADDACSVTMPARFDGTHLLALPSGALAGGGNLVVRFVNAGPDDSCTAIFHAQDGVELLASESGFGANLVRGLLIMLCCLSLLAALGLTAGSMMSFPVAAFTSWSLLAIVLAGHYFVSAPEEPVHEHGQASRLTELVTLAGQHTARGLERVTGPVMRFQPVSWVSGGILVSWRTAAECLLVLVMLYGGLLGVCGASVLRRRELALPS